ncbi:bis-aminopropyl spermidine synthase family protein [Frankia sp. AgPm24]|uniref:bis-aminopropyl spermidine synthase family protein n=1 Tax=Frankia sp. AgPm24 TaxID=631128 RepID=UPI00200DD34C|nr:bis-aminopropyl spermidine synthase family protein [Frankia sp. AgPm24]MCK9923781.1 bis-aminopropyl spermidine synthase family protein [Frankia sp. AgPm24]
MTDPQPSAAPAHTAPPHATPPQVARPDAAPLEAATSDSPVAGATSDQPAAAAAGESLATLLHGYGVHALAPRRVVAALTEQPQTLRGLVQGSGLPRRSVEIILRTLDGDLHTAADGRLVLRAPTVDRYRSLIRYAQLRASAPVDPLAAEVRRHSALITTMHGLIAAAPRPRADLDHVPATAATAVRRAVWLATHYDLREAELLCVGDHDLTSLALLLLAARASRSAHGTDSPSSAGTDGRAPGGTAGGLRVTVVDIDEELLAFLDRCARAHGVALRCLYTDLRLGLPPSVAGHADLVFTDPPYTPSGVSLFAARGAQGLADRERGRVLVAYGYSERTPALGARVQKALLDQGFVFEAIWPGFHVYDGAEAVGARADMYSCQPTAATWKRLDRSDRSGGSGGEWESGGSSTPPRSIYTRGRHAEESQADELAAGALTAAQRFLAAVPGRGVFVGDRPLPQAAAHTRLPTVLDRGLPPSTTGPSGGDTRSVVVDLTDDPGPWLLRLLLAANADRLAVLVDADHPDLRSGQPFDLVRAKWTRTPEHDETPTGAGRTRLLSLTATDQTAGAAPERLVRWLLERAHGRLGNVWRDGLIRVARDQPGAPLAQRAALTTVHAALTTSREGGRDADADATVIPADLLTARLIDLPRHTLADVLDAASTSVGLLPTATA